MRRSEGAAEPGRHLPPPAITALTKSAIAAIAVTLVPQGVWSALIVANLQTVPTIPWSVVVMAGFIVVASRYLSGHWGPSSTVAARRQSLRAIVVSREVFAWAWLAGALSIIALVGLWIVFASLVRMPGSVLPDLSGYPWWTAALAVGMGALISPVCEQAGIWGYWQGALEREVSPFTAVVVTSLIFGLAPHPPAQALLGPKVMFFSLTGLTFSVMAYLTNSILPAIPVHGLGLLAFFTLVWPHDPERRLVGDVGTDVWFWIHVVQIAVFAGLACWAFGRLARVTASARMDSIRGDH
jgi:membrane protease YdiL (CAAX protease family)